MFTANEGHTMVKYDANSHRSRTTGSDLTSGIDSGEAGKPRPLKGLVSFSMALPEVLGSTNQGQLNVV